MLILSLKQILDLFYLDYMCVTFSATEQLKQLKAEISKTEAEIQQAALKENEKQVIKGELGRRISKVYSYWLCWIFFVINVLHKECEYTEVSS